MIIEFQSQEIYYANYNIMKIVVVGGGIAGYVSALMFAHRGRNKNLDIEIWEDPNKQPLNVGQASIVFLPSFLWASLGINWYNNPINALPKFGILYEGWSHEEEFFSSFSMDRVGLHMCPWDLRETILNSGLVNLVQKPIQDISSVTADYIIDCRGMPDGDNLKNNYFPLQSPVNSVVLGKPKKSIEDTFWSRHVATKDGWCFGIPTPTQSKSYPYSYGYLYNNEITSSEEATDNFITQFDISDITSSFSFNNYFTKEPIKDNIFLNGMRLFFLEPMEANSIETYLIWSQLCCDVVFGNLPKDTAVNILNNFIADIQDYLLFHYVYGSKYDTKFWDYASKFLSPHSRLHKVISEVKDMSWMDVTEHSGQFAQWSYWNVKQWYDSMKK